MEYELFYLVLDSKSAHLDSTKVAIKKIIEDVGGTYTDETAQHHRALSYEINKEKSGTYIAQRFTTADKDARHDDLGENNLPKDALADITRLLNLDKNIARFLITKTKGLPPLAQWAEKTAKYENRGAKTGDTKTHLAQKERNVDEKLEEVLNI